MGKFDGGWIRLWVVGSVLWSIYAAVWLDRSYSRHWNFTANLIDYVFWILAPCLFVLALGWAVRWIYRGFSRDRE